MLLLLSFYNLIVLWSSLIWSVDCQIDKLAGDKRVIEDIFYKFLGGSGIAKDSYNGLDECLQALSDKLKDYEELVKRAKVRIDKIWVKDKPQTLTTKVFIDGKVNVQSDLVPRKVVLTKPVVLSSGRDHLELEKRLDQASKDVNSIAYQLEHQVVRKDKSEQKINGTIHFLGPIKAEKITIQTIRPTTKINNISWEDLKYNVLRRSGNQKVTGKWEFKNSLLVGDLKVNGLISGVNMSNVLLTNSPQEQVITGQFKIERGKFRSLSFENINGIDKNDLVFQSGRRIAKITGSKRFIEVRSAANINITGNLNGRNWNRIVENSININSPGYIPTTLTFSTAPTINNLTVRSLNNLQIDNLKAGLTPEELVAISGFKTFRSLTTVNVTLRGKLNGLSVPNDLVTLRSLEKVPGPLTFAGNVFFTNNLTVGKINDVDIVKDTVYRLSDGRQVIQGTKIFDNTVSVRSLKSKETKLRHINLDNLDPKAIDGAQFSRRSNVIYEDSLTIKGDVQVKTINGIPIDHLLNSLFSRTRDQNIHWPTQFNGRLSVDSVTTQTVNGLKVATDLVRINTNGVEQVITGRKMFNKITLGSRSELIMLGQTLNGKDFRSLEKNIIKNDPSMKKGCYGKKTFTLVKVLGNIVAEKVNGLDLEREVMLTDRPQNVTGRLIFTSPVETFHASFPAGLSVRKIDDQSVDEALKNLVLQDDESVTLDNKDFRGGLVADEISLLGKINGVNLMKFINSVVTLDSPQVIHSPLRFEDEVTFDNPINTRSINQHDLQKKFSDIVGTRSLSTKERHIKIYGNVKVNGNLITGQLNHKPPEKLREYIFSPNIDNKFNRPVIFNSSIVIEHLSVDPQATIDGIYPGDLLPLDKPIELVEPMTIRGNVKIDHQLIVRSGKINDCSLQEMASITSYRNTSKALVFAQPINFKEVNILGNLKLIKSPLNDINFDDLITRVEIVVPSNSTYATSFTFMDDVYVDDLVIESPINGVDLRKLLDDSVKKSSIRQQKIAGHKIFKSIKINGSGDVTFNGDVSLRGTINGINVTQLNNDLLNPGTFNTIRGVKIYSSTEPVVLHNIDSPSVGGSNLSDLIFESNNRKYNGRDVTKKRDHLTDPINVKQLKIKRINGIPIENLISTGQNVQLNGSFSVINGDMMLDSRSLKNASQLLERDLQQLEDELRDQTMSLLRAVATIDPEKINFEYFDVFDYFDDFGIATDHIKKIAISKDYRFNRTINYDQGLTQTIYLYYTNQTNECIHETSIFEIHSEGKSPLQDGLINAKGKYFPLVTFQSKGYNGSISVSAWTNFTDCSINPEDRDKFISRVTINNQKDGEQLIQGNYSFSESQAFSDINYFLEDDQIFLITLRSHRKDYKSSINIYQCEPKILDHSACQTIDQLNQPNAVSMEMFHSQKLNKRLLALMVIPVDCESNPTIILYEWKNKKFTDLGTISASNPTTIKFIEIPKRGEINLIVANNYQTGICAEMKSNIKKMVDIWSISNRDHKLKQSIDLNANSISSFMINSQVYIVLSSKSSDKTFIYRYHHPSNSFNQLDQNYITKGVEDVNCFWISPNQLFMIATTSDHLKAQIFSAYLTDFTNN